MMYSESPVFRTMSPRSYYSIILEEIALEGLDGITISVLWRRLQYSKHWTLSLDDSDVKQFVWKILLEIKEVNWYLLPEARKDIYIPDPSSEELVNYELSSNNNIYGFQPIEHKPVKGSCATYDTRTEIKSKMLSETLENIEKRYGDRLIAVAKQRVRSNILLRKDINPQVKLPNVSYCMLERIARSRGHGESSQSLHIFKRGARPAFYYWDILRKLKLVTCQQNLMKVKGRVIQCSIFFLPQFHVEVITKRKNTITSVIKLLKETPRGMAPIQEVRRFIQEVELDNVKRVFRTQLFRNHLEITAVSASEMLSNDSAEDVDTANPRMCKVVSLRNKNVNLDDVLKAEHETPDADDPSFSAVIEWKLRFDQPMLVQLYQVIESAGPAGMSQVDVAKELGLTKLISRSALRTLTKMGHVKVLVKDEGRQRYFLYYAKKFEGLTNSKEQEELKKNMELVRKIQHVRKYNLKFEDYEMEDVESNNRKRKLEGEVENEPATKKSKDNKGESYDSSMFTAKDFPSYKWIRRTNLILEEVYKQEVVCGTATLAKLIKDDEEGEGYSEIPCIKSIQRIIETLVNKKIIKVFQKTVRGKLPEKERRVDFICTPDIAQDHPKVLVGLSQVELNLSIVHNKKYKVKAPPPSLTNNKRLASSNVASKRPKSLVYIKNLSKTLGYTKKFQRMQMTHELIYYLLRGYEGSDDIDEESFKEEIKTNYNITLDDNLPKIYHKDLSWKMFIPPLKKDDAFVEGWISPIDIITRLPLHTLLSTISVKYEVPNIDKYLYDPVKRFLPLANIPEDMRDVITAERRCISGLMDNLRNLCMIGLIQFGFRHTPDITSSFVYLNKRSSLLDTRTCPESYFQIDSSLEFPRHNYEFNCMNEVTRYWSDACIFSVNTKLASKRNATSVRRDSRRIKPCMAEAMRPRTHTDAILNDTGDVPRDKLGAGGFDAMFFSHLARSWHCTKKEMLLSSRRLLKNLLKQPTSKDEDEDNKDEDGTNDSELSSIEDDDEFVMSSMKINKKDKKEEAEESDNKSTPEDEEEEEEEDFGRNLKKSPYDRIDKKAIQKTGSMRCTWSKAEDDLLLLCITSVKYVKVVTANYNAIITIRNILHKESPDFQNKTAAACLRRVKLLRNIHKYKIDMCLRNMRKDTKFTSLFQNQIDTIKSLWKQKKLNKLFQKMDKLVLAVYPILKQAIANVDAYNCELRKSPIPSDVENMKKFCNDGKNPAVDGKKIRRVKTTHDILVHTIKTLIMSTLLTQKSEIRNLDSPYIFTIFKQFPDSLLFDCIYKVRREKMVAFNKSKHVKERSIVPLGTGTHLSMSFHLLLRTMLNLNMYVETLTAYNDFVENSGFTKLKFNTSYNLVLATMLPMNGITFDIQIPDQLIFFKEKMEGAKRRKAGISNVLSTYTDYTESIIKKYFFSNGDNAGGNSKQNKEPVPSTSKEAYKQGDSDSDEGEDITLSNENQTEAKKNLSLFITRSQFKEGDTRFSNAYDNYVINAVPITCQWDTAEDSSVLHLQNNKEEIMKYIEKFAVFPNYEKSDKGKDELKNIIVKYQLSNVESKLMFTILEFIKRKKSIGATRRELLAKFDGDLKLIMKVLDVLREEYVILRSGVNDICFIYKEYASQWLTRCPRDFISKLNEDTNVAPNSSQYLRDQSLIFLKNSIRVVIRPWINADGSVNQIILNSFLIRVLNFVIENPGTTLENIQERFAPALFHNYTRELVEILVKLETVHLTLVKLSTPTLFSGPFANHTIEDAVGFEDADQIVVEAHISAFLKLSTFIGNSVTKDVLDVAYNISLPKMKSGSSKVEDFEGAADESSLADMSSTVNEPSEV